MIISTGSFVTLIYIFTVYTAAYVTTHETKITCKGLTQIDKLTIESIAFKAIIAHASESDLFVKTKCISVTTVDTTGAFVNQGNASSFIFCITNMTITVVPTFGCKRLIVCMLDTMRVLRTIVQSEFTFVNVIVVVDIEFNAFRGHDSECIIILTWVSQKGAFLFCFKQGSTDRYVWGPTGPNWSEIFKFFLIRGSLAL